MVDLLGEGKVSRTRKGAIPRWAVRYGYSERAVKNFIATGKAVGEAPPFDDPDQLEEWGRRHLGKLTRRFLNGVEQAKGGALKPPDEPKTDEEPKDNLALPEVAADEMGVENQLAGYHREFAMLRTMRETALRAGEFSRANNYFDQQQKVSSEIRQLERLLPTILEQRGDYQRTAEVRAATVEFLTILKRAALGRGNKAAARLKAAHSDAEIQDVWRAEINAVFAECCEGKFEP